MNALSIYIKPLVAISITILLSCPAYAQSPSKKIGLQLLQMFQGDSLVKLNTLRIPDTDISSFLHSNGIDTLSVADYIFKYPASSKSLVAKANGFRHDSTKFPIDWPLVQVVDFRENITERNSRGTVESSQNIIEFKSDVTAYILFFETAVGKDGSSYLGNSINLVKATLSKTAE